MTTVAELQARLGDMTEDRDNQAARADEAERAEDAAREAIEFYAAQHNWREGEEHECPAAIEDAGEIARSAWRKMDDGKGETRREFEERILANAVRVVEAAPPSHVVESLEARADEAEEALGAAKLDAEMAREAIATANERAERAEAALRDLARAATEVTSETSIDSDGQGYVWGGHVKTLAEAVRLAEAVLDDGLPDTMAPPGKEADTLAPDPADAQDEAWLLARARGEHVEHPDPERAAGYVRLEEALRSTPRREPPPGWEARVMKAIDEKGGE